MSQAKVQLRINGTWWTGEVDHDERLIDTLRERCGLTGTHQGCDTAQCGACTVTVDGRALKSCNRLTLQTDSSALMTIEGVSDGENGLHLLQQAFSRHHALQCGFCTPGFIMRALAMVNEDVAPEPAAVREALSGNLCRCTGYDGIVKAICETLPILRRAAGALD